MYSKIRFPLLLLLSLTLLFSFGCSEDDDNPVSDTPSEHLEAVGTMLIQDSDTLVVVNGTSVEGELEVHEGHTLGPINILFLHPDGYWYDPTDGASALDDTDHILVIEEYDSDIVNVLIGTDMSGNTDPWAFGLSGLEAGETSARIKIYHIDHPDYVSPLIPIHVEHEHGHASAVGCKLVMNGEDAVTVDGTTITGELHVHEGHTPTVTVWFLDPDGDWFQPHADDGYSLDISSANTEVFSVTPDSENPWAFTASGNEEGETTLTAAVLHGDHADYTSPALPVHVVHAHASAVGCKLVMNGEDAVTVDGTTITGELHVHEGHTPTVTVWFLDPDGDWFQPHADDGYSLDISSANTEVLSVTPDSENPWAFTASGNEEGETTLTAAVLHGDHADYTSPALPVHVVHQHITAVGCKLTLDEVDVVTVDGSTVTGSLELTNGETTGLITVTFLNPDGEWFQPDDKDYTVEVSLTGSNFTVQSDAGDRYQFTATGTEVGSGQLELQLYHIDHSHFTSPQIPVNTTARN